MRRPKSTLLLAAAVASPALAQDFLVAGPDGLMQVDRQGQVVRHVPAPPGAGPFDSYTDLIDLPDGTWLARYRREHMLHYSNVARVFGPQGDLREEWSVTGAFLGRSLATRQDGTLVVAEKKVLGVLWGAVRHSSSDGDLLANLAFGGLCGGVVVRGDDSMLVGRVYSPGIEAYDAAGVLQAAFPTEPFFDMDAAPDGTVWLLCTDLQVRNYDLDGSLLASFPHGGAVSLAVDRDGTLWLGSGKHLDGVGNLLGSVSFPQHVDGLSFVRGPRRVGAALCAGQPNSTGTAGRLAAYGGSAADAEVLSLRAAGLPVGTVAALLVSTGGGHVPGLRGGAGELCLDPARVQAAGLRQTDASGRAEWAPDLDALPVPGGTTEVLAGSSWAWQVWYHDVNPQPTSNLTGAVRVTFE